MSNKIWRTSDLHFGHDREFIYSERGFKSVDDMNEQLIKNYNELIDDDDEVYILGDCSVGCDAFNSVDLIAQLKGDKNLIIGNHDSDKRLDYWKSYELFNTISFGARFIYKKYHFYLSHYPTLVANYDSWPKVWNLCGHTHTKDRFVDFDKGCYHVEVDAHSNYPVSIEQVIDDLKFKRSLLTSPH